MKQLATLILLFFVCACTKKMPEAPASLNAAILQVSAAVQNNASGEVATQCETLVRELAEFNTNHLPVRSQADLKELTLRIAAFGAAADGATPVVAPQWNDIRNRLDRVLKGQSPENGSRYQVDMPVGVSDAIALVDQAIASGDKETALKAIANARYPISEWAQKMPGPRAARINDVAESELLMFTMVPSDKQTLESIRTSWERAKRKLSSGE